MSDSIVAILLIGAATSGVCFLMGLAAGVMQRVATGRWTEAGDGD